jgi:hypothetical protein
MASSDRERARPIGGASILWTLLIIFAVAACGGAAAPQAISPAGPPAGSAGGIGTDGGSGGGAGAGGGSGTDDGAANGPTGGNGDGGPVVDAVRPDLLVIKTGTLTLEVDDVNAAVAAASARIAGLGGYVSGSSQSGDGDGVKASITYRIPADRWEDALLALRGMATTVVAEQTQTDDVSGQVVDLAARVRNLEATERAVQEVMDRATTIDEILTVQTELTRIRGEIEEASSTKGHLEEQATFSTLTVLFGLVPAPEATPDVAIAEPAFDPGDEVNKATASLVAVLERLAKVGIWFGIVWLPILVALGLVVLGGWLVLRRRYPGRVSQPWSGPGAAPLAPGEPAAPAVED